MRPIPGCQTRTVLSHEAVATDESGSQPRKFFSYALKCPASPAEPAESAEYATAGPSAPLDRDRRRRCARSCRRGPDSRGADDSDRLLRIGHRDRGDHVGGGVGEGRRSPRWRWLGAAYGLYAVGALALPMALPSERLGGLYSFPRFALAAFPCLVVLAVLGRPRSFKYWSESWAGAG